MLAARQLLAGGEDHWAREQAWQCSRNTLFAARTARMQEYPLYDKMRSTMCGSAAGAVAVVGGTSLGGAVGSGTSTGVTVAGLQSLPSCWCEQLSVDLLKRWLTSSGPWAVWRKGWRWF